MDGWMDGWMDECIVISYEQYYSQLICFSYQLKRRASLNLASGGKFVHGNVKFPKDYVDSSLKGMAWYHTSM